MNVAPWQAETDVVSIEDDAVYRLVVRAGTNPVTAERSRLTPVGCPVPPHPGLSDVIAPAVTETMLTSNEFVFVTVIVTSAGGPAGRSEPLNETPSMLTVASVPVLALDVPVPGVVQWAYALAPPTTARAVAASRKRPVRRSRRAGPAQEPPGRRFLMMTLRGVSLRRTRPGMRVRQHGRARSAASGPDGSRQYAREIGATNRP